VGSDLWYGVRDMIDVGSDLWYGVRDMIDVGSDLWYGVRDKIDVGSDLWYGVRDMIDVGSDLWYGVRDKIDVGSDWLVFTITLLFYYERCEEARLLIRAENVIILGRILVRIQDWRARIKSLNFEHSFLLACVRCLYVFVYSGE
jgi:hypothetical protein